MSECQTKAGNQESFEKLENLKNLKPENLKTQKLKNSKTQKLKNFENITNDLWDMLNNFCFHVYAQKSLFIAENCNGFLVPC